MKSSISFLCTVILCSAAFALVMAPATASAQANPFGGAAQNQVNAINSDAGIADKDQAILDAIETMIGDNNASDAPNIAAAFIEAMGIDDGDSMFAAIVYLATSLAQDYGQQIANAAAEAAGGSESARRTANNARSQANNDAANAEGATQQGSSTSGGITAFAASGGTTTKSDSGSTSPPDMMPVP